MSKEQKDIIFLINPISGVGQKKDIPALIEQHIQQHSYQIRYTQYRGHGSEIAAAEKDQAKAIIAIGGDGTVNEVAAALTGSNCAIGIIPTGSGNGLARHLKIPLTIKAALERINRFEIQTYDTGMVNDHFFVGTAGFGFDAHIAHCFDEHPKRGFLTYASLIAKEYKKYQPRHYIITLEDQKIERSALFCAVANSSQFGNGFTISPGSDMQDGKMELVLVDKFPLIESMIVGTRFFTQSIENSKHYERIPFNKNISIEVNSTDVVRFHLDGEPLQDGPQFDISIQAQSLQII